ncbi:LacI family DNA-binding transcriptional regulator [soil metagenome]
MTEPRKRTVLKDVAQRAEVSLTAASLVLNGKAGPSIPEETQARILAAATELGYRPNALARGLRSGLSATIGFISDEIATTPFAGAMIQGAQDAAWEAGKLLLLINTGRDPVIEATALELLHERHVEGVIYATMYHQVIEPPAALREGPAVLLDARTTDGSLPSVAPDEFGAARDATRALMRAGHRRIGFVQDREPIPAAPEREEGYLAALQEGGQDADPALVARGAATADGGWRAAGELLDGRKPPTALFCFNDQMAMGAYRAAAERGLRVPDDISVVGFDDQELIAPWLVPSLTTMALPHYAMGRWAVEFLVRHDASAPQHRMPCPLIERDSVVPPSPAFLGRPSTLTARAPAR